MRHKPSPGSSQIGRKGGPDSISPFLRLGLAVDDRSVNWTLTQVVHANAAILELGSPGCGSTLAGIDSYNVQLALLFADRLKKTIKVAVLVASSPLTVVTFFRGVADGI